MNHRTILISGASRGLGAATARLAARLGANVALMARSASELEKLAAEIVASGGQALALPGDVRQPADCQRAVDQAASHFGGLEALINNAGQVEPVAPLAESDPQAWQENWQVNVLGAVSLIQAALPHLRQSKGRVVNVSSGAAVGVVPGWGAYSTAKAALNHLTAFLAAEEPAVTALAFRPGIVDTAMQAVIRQHGAQGMTAEDHARFVGYHQRGELKPPEKPGLALVVLALYAPSAWSGEFIAWDDPRVQDLIRQHASQT